MPVTTIELRGMAEAGGPGARRRAASLALLVVVAAVGGALATLSHPPQRWPGMAVVGAALGMWSLWRSGGALRGTVCGLAWGLAFAALLFRWAAALDVVALVALASLQALFWAGAGAAISVLARRSSTTGTVIASAAVWTLMEALRARWPLGGFEWGQLGLAAADLPIRSAAAIVGTLGLTALGALVAAGLAGLAVDPARAWKPLLAALAAVGALSVLGGLEWTEASGSLDVAVVQVDDPCPGAFAVDCPDFRQRLLDSHVEGTDSLEGDYELLLWGEGTLRGETAGEAGAAAAEAMGGRLPAPLLAGVANPGGPGRFHQRNVLYAVDGEALDTYDKRHPVPFGEYVPLRSVLGSVGDVGRLVPTDIVRGERAVAMSVPTDGGTVDLGTVVSWEVTFSRGVREAGALGEAVATLTTQASYGPGQPVSDQLLGAAQMRAAELHKAQVIAATTGRSALVAPDGQLQGPTALYAADSLTARVPLRSGLTPYARLGELPVVALAALAVGLVMLLVRRDSADRL